MLPHDAARLSRPCWKGWDATSVDPGYPSPFVDGSRRSKALISMAVWSLCFFYISTKDKEDLP